jgi:hypothetical protein
MTNLNEFVKGPKGTPGLITSYDRSGGNSDWARGLKPAADGLYTLADLKGPGCVHRIWMTGIKPEAWYFFFDGETAPRIKLEGLDLFEQVSPFLAPLNDRVSNGTYSYTPFPYQESLRIAVGVKAFTPDMRFYYHINYETLPAETRVVSFPKTLSDMDQQQLVAVRKAWRSVQDAAGRVATKAKASEPVSLLPGKHVVVAEEQGSGMVQSLALQVSHADSVDAVAREAVLREVVLRVFWDGATAPSVEVPLGDFFCNGLWNRPFAAMPLARVDDVYVCRFPMPFKADMRMELRNDGAKALNVKAAVEVGDRPSSLPLKYFHAAWRGRRENGRPFQLLLAKGKGHYVGCYLTALGMETQWNILEGDESIRLDDRLAPDFHGTGLEDYFNGAWYYDGVFDLPLHGLLEKAAMRTSQYRFHLNDAVRFNRAISVQFEFGHGNRSRGYMSGTAYWYADAPASAGSWIPPAGGRSPYPDPLERATFMAGLFELEREGLLSQARERCLSYAKRYAGQPEVDMVRLRAAAYADAGGDQGTAVAEYKKLSEGGDEVTKAAESLLWLHEGPGRALVGTHINGTYRLYIDGKLVQEGKGEPTQLSMTQARLAPGKHVITVEVIATRPMPWMSACIKTAGTNITTSGSWQVTLQKPAGWPARAAINPGEGWQDAGVHGLLPNMYYWQYYPNAMVRAQSGRQVLYPPGTWTQGKPAYFRGEVTVPGPMQDPGAQ